MIGFVAKIYQIQVCPGEEFSAKTLQTKKLQYF